MSEEKNSSSSSRRDWLKSFVRNGAVLGLIGGVGHLVVRSACAQTPCRACPLADRCDLAKAQDSRDEQRRGDTP